MQRPSLVSLQNSWFSSLNRGQAAQVTHTKDNKIKVEGTLVELEGDEMASILFNQVKKQVSV